MRVAALSAWLALLLSACASSGEHGTFSGGLNFGASAGGGSGLGGDSYGRRVDLDSSLSAPSLPSIGTPGLGK